MSRRRKPKPPIRPGQVWRGRGPQGGRFVRIVRVKQPREHRGVTEPAIATAREVSRHGKLLRGKRDGLRRDLPIRIVLCGAGPALRMPPWYELYESND